MQRFQPLVWHCALLFPRSFDEETLEDIYRRLDKLRPGAVVILSTHKIPSPMFEVLFEGRVGASWGDVTVRIYRKKQLPAWVAGVLGRTGATPARASASASLSVAAASRAEASASSSPVLVASAAAASS